MTFRISSHGRLQDWIAYPTIAAEKLNVDKGADYMRQLLFDAWRESVVPQALR